MPMDCYKCYHFRACLGGKQPCKLQTANKFYRIAISITPLCLLRHARQADSIDLKGLLLPNFLTGLKYFL